MRIVFGHVCHRLCIMARIVQRFVLIQRQLLVAKPRPGVEMLFLSVS